VLKIEIRPSATGFASARTQRKGSMGADVI
jgi:hypothetical protein